MRGVKAWTVIAALALILILASAPAWAVVVAQQAPVIELIIPPAAWPGTPVAIQGTNFGLLQVPGISTVTFNGVDAGPALFWSDNYIVVTVPDEATTGPVVVTTLEGSSNGYEFTVFQEVPTFSCYFAEGTTRSGFEEWLTLYNPWDEDLVATVTYMIADAANRIRYYNVPAHTRVSVYVNSEIGSDRDVSVTVTSTARLVAERPMYFRYKGEWSGGHCTAPALEPSGTWYFAEGTTHAGFEEWLCLANPNDQDADVQVTYIFADGEALTLPYLVPAMKRFTVDVNSVVGPGRDVALKVESDQPVVAERPMYFNYRWMWDGGHITTGATMPHKTWYFAEGTTRSGFEEWLCLANPGGASADARVTYFPADGGEVNQDLVIPARRRSTINVNSVVGPGRDVALKVESDQPVVAERPMYFNYRWMWDGGHITTGATMPHKTWYFAEGTTRSGFEEWLCLANPGDLDARVSVNYVFQDGGTQVQELTLAPGQRFTVAVNQVVGPDMDVSVKVEGDQELVVERSLYFTYHDAWDGGHNTIGCSP